MGKVRYSRANPGPKDARALVGIHVWQRFCVFGAVAMSDGRAAKPATCASPSATVPPPFLGRAAEPISPLRSSRLKAGSLLPGPPTPGESRFGFKLWNRGGLFPRHVREREAAQHAQRLVKPDRSGNALAQRDLLSSRNAADGFGRRLESGGTRPGRMRHVDHAVDVEVARWREHSIIIRRAGVRP